MERGLLVAVMLATGCGAATPSVEDFQRSDKEYELAGALYAESNVASALQHLGTSLEYDQNNTKAHILLGHIHLQRRDFEKAENHLQKAIELLQKRPELASERAEAGNLLGVVYMLDRKYALAEKVFKETASDMLNPTPWLAWGNLGSMYLEQKRYAEAKDALVTAVNVQPRFCLGYRWLGQLFIAQEQLEDADIAFTRSVEPPETDELCSGAPNQLAWRLRGETRAQLGNRDDAISDLERCIEL
ncbi:MAG: tetratricopeptide repeat protein, partial [Myxococcales bacterium]|nr:tetratricopeptide repeat protein [Myxococcales bacterium]